MTGEQLAVRKALRAAAERHGLIADILDAHGKVESLWKMNAQNHTGADEARGGAYGPTQITERTARAAGFTEPMIRLCYDAELAAEWTCCIMLRRPGGPPRTVEDSGAWWNAGRGSFAELPLIDAHGKPFSTRADYVPRMLAAVEWVRANPVA